MAAGTASAAAARGFGDFILEQALNLLEVLGSVAVTQDNSWNGSRDILSFMLGVQSSSDHS